MIVIVSPSGAELVRVVILRSGIAAALRVIATSTSKAGKQYRDVIETGFNALGTSRQTRITLLFAGILPHGIPACL